MDNINTVTYCLNNNSVEIQDLIKYIHQSCRGCGHLVGDYASALEGIRRELEDSASDDLPEIECIGGGYCRVHLKICRNGLSPETLCRLFIRSADTGPAGLCDPAEEAEKLISYAREKKIPFSGKDAEKEIREWINNGCPAVHHSENYRKAHSPAYRVIRKEYVRLIPLLTEIDRLMQSRSGNVTVALDGRCASGKTTAAGILAEIYDCNVFHMDDFFLRPEQRTEERLSRPGENVDHERFLEEVLLPLSENRTVSFRRYDCSAQALEAPVQCPRKKLNIVEGVYSMHPSLIDKYTLTAYTEITAEEQKRRILRRNSPETAEMFFRKWIPLEEQYFDSLAVREKAGIIIEQ